METRGNGERRETGPWGDAGGQCPRTRRGNGSLTYGGKKLSQIQTTLGESLLPRIKEEVVCEPLEYPRGSCKGFHCSVTTGGAGYGKLTFGQGTTLTVHPSKCNRTQQHTGNSGISPLVLVLREMCVA